ncbi:hypothetical protein AYO21_11750 [Fonsecaea monophora]|uniref:Protein NO VEIN C-terminal domain-containing protein n=1 Tax=Fonsecaea monophora TaxID=254056 RepID=A0A177ESZ7_9EURO|nr:hypothetical protein AYO21_11750 [Fonsecaea monophora]OAG34109.1 hypothetical protein AYO21_11750 [Fonsecaea monophora]
MDNEFSAFYEELYQKPLAEPQNEQDAQNILSCILARHGNLNSEDETLLQGTTSILHRKVTMIARNSRKILAQFTKAFFFELLQNADDAQYRWTTDVPAIRLTVNPTELIVDLNEDGFSLSDILSICSTGQSSKALNEESTGEKGFGFKAVFGIAHRVHINSRLWSFRFEHQRHEDGIGMISPKWEPRETLPTSVRTRFRLEYSLSDQGSLSSLCAWLEALPASMIFALRRIKRISICFQNTECRNYSINFEKTSEDAFQTTIRSQVGDRTEQHLYRTFTTTNHNMPTQAERPWSASTVKIGLPVTGENRDIPHLTPGGQYVLAYLPVVQMPQLPFVIQADFILTASRQAVSDNPWNRVLRDLVARLFAGAIGVVAAERSQLGFKWPVYVPVQPLGGFWQPLQGLITTYLAPLKLFYSREGDMYRAYEVRMVPSDIVHDNEPLLPATSQRWWRFLSAGYKDSPTSTLNLLGVGHATYEDELALLDDAIAYPNASKLRTVPLQDAWHDSFLDFIRRAMEVNGARYQVEIKNKRIVPVRVRGGLEWYTPNQMSYFPNLVDEGAGIDRVQIEMPGGLDLVVLHPDAARNPARHMVYQSLGVGHCPPVDLNRAILSYQYKAGDKFASDLLSCLQLLFWFSHMFLPFSEPPRLVALAGTGGYKSTRELFMRSQQPYHAECLLRLQENPQHGNHFLDESYQASPIATRSRNNLTWEQWLSQVAGIRWFPPLNDGDKLHWMIETIRTENPTIFVPLLQHYWLQDYASVCRFHGNIKVALMKSQVLCQNGKYEELYRTWFPTRFIVESVRYYGIDPVFSILQLPESTEDYVISQWSSLSDLGVRSDANLSFYKEALSLLCATGQTPLGSVQGLNYLYRNMGGRTTLAERQTLKNDFVEKTWVWDPIGSKWRTLGECVWESAIELKCKFALIPTYTASFVSELFQTLLEIGNVTVSCLVDELEYMKKHSPTELDEEILDRASALYTLLKGMVQDDAHRKWIRSAFKQNDLIYNRSNGSWLRSSLCIWHATIDIGNHVPIATMYPELQEFFVDTLGVSTVTSGFMMKQLAAAATRPQKDVNEIKKLMLSTSQSLSADNRLSEVEKSVDSLLQSQFLPCKTPQTGDIIFRTTSETFFILDNQYYGEKFSGKIFMLDFTYEQLISLHELFRVLRLDDRYLTRHVGPKTSADGIESDILLTEQFRLCAYAISCCAISHRSTLYSNQNTQMYNDLVSATVQTSADMSTKVVVVQDSVPVEVVADRLSLVIEQNDAGLSITLPKDKVQRMQCMRGQLPGRLAEMLNIYDSRGEKQLYRILNELESGTDDILLQEDISRVSWLPETCRPNPTPPAEELEGTFQPQSAHIFHGQPEGVQISLVKLEEVESPTRAMGSIAANSYPDRPSPLFRALPAAKPTHATEAHLYWLVLEHVPRQASSFRHVDGNDTDPTFSRITKTLATLSLEVNTIDPAKYPELFGGDFSLSKFRVGAAGELFVYEILGALLPGTLGLDNWQSKIRHLVRAHKQYEHVTRWTQRETADMMYSDQNNSLRTLFRTRPLGDVFPDWAPDWLAADDENPPLEWLFEVKTSLGPCETEFYMSPHQHDLMRNLGDTKHNAPRRQVYCIVRVYNLLSNQIGISFFIDPWRFREGRLEFDTTDKWKVTASRAKYW